MTCILNIKLEKDDTDPWTEYFDGSCPFTEKYVSRYQLVQLVNTCWEFTMTFDDAPQCQEFMVEAASGRALSPWYAERQAEVRAQHPTMRESYTVL